ncbi:MAG: helix-turn-helix domain-containing protein [Nitrospiraceae bacterium]
MAIVEEDEILGTADVAVELEITPDWVRQLVRAGRLRALKTRRGQNVFLGKEVQRFKVERQRLADQR